MELNINRTGSCLPIFSQIVATNYKTARTQDYCTDQILYLLSESSLSFKYDAHLCSSSVEREEERTCKLWQV